MLIGYVYEGLGRIENALDWLEQAVEERDGWFVYVNSVPRFESLRDEPSQPDNASTFQKVPVLGKTFEHLHDITARGCDLQPVRARVLHHCTVELAREPLAPGFAGDPRVVDHDVAVSCLPVGHDGVPANGEFTVGWRFRVFNVHLFAVPVQAPAVWTRRTGSITRLFRHSGRSQWP
jgi:hypothetical protein